ncbi:MAG: hypothetical protein RIQ62_1712 [Bacteroidota bacterium]|jgi:hypothetical protein
MKRFLCLFTLLFLLNLGAVAQCSMCTKTAASLDDKSARGLNGGILFLAAMPLAMMGFIGFTWWQRNRQSQ